VDVLVDTGATYTMIHRAVLESLGVVAVRKKLIRPGDGRTMERGLGLAYVRYGKYESPTWILFGEAGDAAVLGALTLEELSLQVDPESRQLREVDTAMMVVVAA
jgi:predicted aspartyl protease